jgi:hypothetical protein
VPANESWKIPPGFTSGNPDNIEHGDVVFLSWQTDNPNDFTKFSNLASIAQGSPWHHIGIAARRNSALNVIEFAQSTANGLPWVGDVAERTWAKASDRMKWTTLRLSSIDANATVTAAEATIGSPYSIAALSAYALATKARALPGPLGRNRLLDLAWGAIKLKEDSGGHTCVSAALVALAEADLGSFSESDSPPLIDEPQAIAQANALSQRVREVMGWPEGMAVTELVPGEALFTDEELIEASRVEIGGPSLTTVAQYLDLLTRSTKQLLENVPFEEILSNGRVHRAAADGAVHPWIISPAMLYERLVDRGATEVK